jgi:hypothetical protein
MRLLRRQWPRMYQHPTTVQQVICFAGVTVDRLTDTRPGDVGESPDCDHHLPGSRAAWSRSGRSGLIFMLWAAVDPGRALAAATRDDAVYRERRISRICCLSRVFISRCWSSCWRRSGVKNRRPECLFGNAAAGQPTSSQPASTRAMGFLCCAREPGHGLASPFSYFRLTSCRSASRFRTRRAGSPATGTLVGVAGRRSTWQP